LVAEIGILSWDFWKLCVVKLQHFSDLHPPLCSHFTPSHLHMRKAVTPTPNTANMHAQRIRPLRTIERSINHHFRRGLMRWACIFAVFGVGVTAFRMWRCSLRIIDTGKRHTNRSLDTQSLTQRSPPIPNIKDRGSGWCAVSPYQ
jgi:hypothetical protein